jgi:hypothetical protein
MTSDSDSQDRLTARRIGQEHPNWQVLWGLHSRQFWAFPLFHAPGGTIVHGRDPGELARQMQQAELSAQQIGRPPARHG